jgi:hypothetical protein
MLAILLSSCKNKDLSNPLARKNLAYHPNSINHILVLLEEIFKTNSMTKECTPAVPKTVPHSSSSLISHDSNNGQTHSHTETMVTLTRTVFFQPATVLQWESSKATLPNMWQIKNHRALDCYHRMDYAYQGRHPPAQLATMIVRNNNSQEDEQPWFADSGANTHITSELEVYPSNNPSKVMTQWP